VIIEAWLNINRKNAKIASLGEEEGQGWHSKRWEKERL
jgi:hypothetical protein